MRCQILSWILQLRTASEIACVSKALLTATRCALSWAELIVRLDHAPWLQRSHVHDLRTVLRLARHVVVPLRLAEVASMFGRPLLIPWYGSYPYQWRQPHRLFPGPPRWIQPVLFDAYYVQESSWPLTITSVNLYWTGRLFSFQVGLTTAVTCTSLTAALNSHNLSHRPFAATLQCACSHEGRQRLLSRQRWYLNGVPVAISSARGVRSLSTVQSVPGQRQRRLRIVVRRDQRTLQVWLGNAEALIQSFDLTPMFPVWPPRMRLCFAFRGCSFFPPRVLVQPKPTLLYRHDLAEILTVCEHCAFPPSLTTTICAHCCSLYCPSHGGRCCLCDLIGCSVCLGNHAHVTGAQYRRSL